MVEDAVQHASELVRLNTLLAQLPDREREIIALKYGANMTNRKIATLLEISESHVGTIVHRVLRQLRQLWDWEEVNPQ
jgi:RNA polymerase sigma-70 factor (ECF subfamily)